MQVDAAEWDGELSARGELCLVPAAGAYAPSHHGMIAATGNAAGVEEGPSTTSEFTCRARARCSRSIGSDCAAHALRSGSVELCAARSKSAMSSVWSRTISDM